MIPFLIYFQSFTFPSVALDKICICVFTFNIFFCSFVFVLIFMTFSRWVILVHFVSQCTWQMLWKGMQSVINPSTMDGTMYVL